MSKKKAVNVAIDNYEGAFHPTEIVTLSGASIPYVNNIINGKHAVGELVQVKEGRKTKYRKNAEYEAPADAQATVEKDLPPVADRFAYIEVFTDMVIESMTASLISKYSQTWLSRAWFRACCSQESQAWVRLTS
jgi:hypothetical protein